MRKFFEIFLVHTIARGYRFSVPLLMGFLWGLGRGPVVSEIGEFETSFAGCFVEVGH